MRKPSGEFKPDLGVVPFHLGCNALFFHPNCGLCSPPCDHAADPIYWVGPNSPDEDWRAFCSECDAPVEGRDDEYDGAPCCRAQVTAGTMSGEHEPGCNG